MAPREVNSKRGRRRLVCAPLGKDGISMVEEAATAAGSRIL
jgi:hypothetical protein